MEILAKKDTKMIMEINHFAKKITSVTEVFLRKNLKLFVDYLQVFTKKI